MKRTFRILSAAAACWLGASVASAQAVRGRDQAQAGGQRLTDVRTGALPAREGQRLRLVTDIGGIRVVTSGTASNQVSYTVRVETDSRLPDARALMQQFRVNQTSTPEGVLIRGSAPWKKEFRGRLWVTFEVQVPRRFDVEAETGAGNIELQEIDGRAALVSLGGNITVHRATGMVKINTSGGHVKVGDVGGDLTAVTGGGHVEVGKVHGGAYLRSEGGHVKVLSVEKWAELRTVGGNIYLQRTGGKVLVESGGGQINLGEVAGAVQAKTAGGGIQIARVSGPTNIETAGGSIYLKQVLNTVNANTGSGQITAWFANTGEKQIPGVSQLVCGEGDIVVYLPREIALSIEATIEAASEHQIIAPQFELHKTWVRSPGGPRMLQAKALLNGGGNLLKLRTVAGNIKLVRVEGSPVVVPPAPPTAPPPEDSAAQFTWRQRVEHRLRGRIQVSSEVQATRLAHKVDPRYPERARKEGVEGWVWLHAMIREDGTVEELNVISGHPWLADAAVEAVRQWRYRPTLLDGKPVRVETVVKVMFTLK